jgi:putative peptide zinc metalloprotease protein
MLKKSDRITITSKDGIGSVVSHKDTGKSYRLGENETKVLLLMNGDCTITDICEKCPYYSEEEIELLIEEFKKMSFLQDSNNIKAKRKKQILKIEFPLFCPDNVLKPTSKAVTLIWFFITYISLPLTILGLILTDYSRIDISEVLFNKDFYNIHSVIIIFIASWIFLTLHEFAHAIAARHYDIHVPEMGLMFYWFMLYGYTDLSGIQLIDNKKIKIVTLAEGMLLNIFLGGVFLYIAIMCGLPKEVSFYFLYFAVINFTMAWANVSVFLRVDGYYIFEVLLDETRLNEKSFEYLSSIGKKLFHKNNENISEVLFLLAYGISALLYPITLIIGMLMSFVGGFN